jgi:hypothetical protein
MAAAVNRAAATRGVRDWTGLADEAWLGEVAYGVPAEGGGAVGVVTGAGVPGEGVAGAGAGAVGGLAGGGDPEEAPRTRIDSFIPKL